MDSVPGGGGGHTWDTVAPVKVDDIQTGRVVYINIIPSGDGTFAYTKASAGKIISCIKEGFIPILRATDRIPAEGDTPGSTFIEWTFPKNYTFIENDDGTFVLDFDNTGMYYSDPDGDLSKPFTNIESSGN